MRQSDSVNSNPQPPQKLLHIYKQTNLIEDSQSLRNEKINNFMCRTNLN